MKIYQTVLFSIAGLYVYAAEMGIALAQVSSRPRITSNAILDRSISQEPISQAIKLKLSFAEEAREARSRLVATPGVDSSSMRLALKFLDSLNAYSLNPRLMSRSELSVIYCYAPFTLFETQFPKVKARAFHECKDPVTGIIVTERFDEIFGPERNQLTKNSYLFADYFFALNQKKVDFVNWQTWRVAELIRSHFLAGSDPFAASGSSEAIFSHPRLQNSIVAVPIAKFDRSISEAFFERQLRRSLDLSTSRESILMEKDTRIKDAVLYDSKGRAVDFRPGLPLNGPGLGFPFIIINATALGRGVAIERSTFSEVIGTYSYAWQILFHTDVWSDFGKGYSTLGRAVENFSWFVWANMVAGQNASDTLRDTRYFKDNFAPVTIDE